MYPLPGEVLHFSEDPTISIFTPHVAPSTIDSTAYVWAVDGPRAPGYWFPRDCPRAMAWVTEHSRDDDVGHILGPGGGGRVHAVEYSRLDQIRTVELFAYRLPADSFEPIGDPEPHALVSTRSLRPIGPPEPVGDLFELHASAGIQLRVLPRLQEFWAAVITSTLGFSGIRLRNAEPAGTVG